MVFKWSSIQQTQVSATRDRKRSVWEAKSWKAKGVGRERNGGQDDGWSLSTLSYAARAKWGRPDADDDADANEQNMRRHPTIPLPSVRSLVFSACSHVRLSFSLASPPSARQVSIVVRVYLKTKKKKARTDGRGKEKAVFRNENRTIYPSDYSRHPPRLYSILDLSTYITVSWLSSQLSSLDGR